jgi:hypothetical protein
VKLSPAIRPAQAQLPTLAPAQDEIWLKALSAGRLRRPPPVASQRAGLFKHSLRQSEVWRRETFSKSIVDGQDKIMCFPGSTLINPKTRKSQSCPQLE